MAVVLALRGVPPSATAGLGTELPTVAGVASVAVDDVPSAVRAASELICTTPTAAAGVHSSADAGNGGARLARWLTRSAADRTLVLSTSAATALEAAGMPGFQVRWHDAFAHPAPWPAARLATVEGGGLDAAPPNPRLPAGFDRTEITSFLGRESDLAEVCDQVLANRLVTLVGPGGVGKTRLADAAALELELNFEVLVRVELAPVEDEDHVQSTVDTASQGALLGGLASARTLVLLDNCEHVPTSAAEAARVLVNENPGVTVLATSRTRLGGPGELVREVTPLRVDDAARLYVERAHLVAPDTTSGPEVVSVVHRLDGLPLAIELAAARSRVAGPAELVKLLDATPLIGGKGSDDRPSRHRTLTATIGWSYDLLDDGDRRALRLLSTAAGEFDADEASHLLGGYALDALERLVDSSLVTTRRQGGTTWFSLLHTIREFARGLRDEAERTTAAARLVDWLDDVTAPFDGMVEHRPIDDRLDHGVGDVRQGLDAALADRGRALLLAGRLSPWWQSRGRVEEGRRWTREVLEDTTPEHDLEPGDLARALNGAANLALRAGDFEEAEALYGSCLKERRRRGSPERLATALNDLGTCRFHAGDLDGAASALREALDIHVEIANSWGQGCTELNLASVASARGELADAEGLTRAAREHFHPDPAGQLLCDLTLACLAEAANDLSQAERGFLHVLDRLEICGVREILPQVVEGLARVAAKQGDGVRAVRLLAGADALRRRTGLARMPDEQAEVDRSLKIATDSLPAHLVATARAAGSGLDDEALIGEAALPRAESTPRPPERGIAPEVLRFAREGEVWAIGPVGHERRLRQTRGLELLAQLLARPEHEHHVLELSGSSKNLGGGTGPVLDSTARAAMGQRYEALQDELADAERLGDGERAARAETELDALARSLSAALGLGGRDRTTNDPAERARKAVGNRVREAIARIAKDDPELGRHLDNAVHLGTYCTYRPDRPITWKVEL